MPKAGYCKECNENVWLKGDGSCQFGRPASSISNVYEAEPENPICPYCFVVLEKRPKRKSKCPSCGKPIYVKSHPSDRQKRLVTEKEAKRIEQEWKRYYTADELAQYGTTQKDFEVEEKRLSKKFGKQPLLSDVVWGLLNKQITRTRDLQSLKMIYHKMAMILHEEGKNPFELLKKAAQMELLRIQREGIAKKVEVLTSGNGCKECEKLSGKTFTIKRALEEMPIPNKDCSHLFGSEKFPFCRCMYVEVF